MEKKTSKNILLVIMGVLIVVELAFGVMTLGEDYLFLDIICLLPLVFVALYGFWLYKKPHGNMLKYAMLIAAVANILVAVFLVKVGLSMDRQIARIFASLIVVYVAGRLNRIEQNKYLLPIAVLIQFVCAFLGIISYSKQCTPIVLLSWLSDPISVLILMIAYFVRFKEHKEAGLLDKQRK